MNLKKQTKLHERLTTVFTGQPGPDHGYTGPCVDPLIPEPTGKERGTHEQLPALATWLTAAALGVERDDCCLHPL